MLLSYGADPNVKGQNNQTASDIAEEQADMFLLGYIKGIRGTYSLLYLYLATLIQ